MKYLQAPLGDYIPRNASQAKKNSVDKDLLARWRKSLLACTSLSQVTITVSWGRGVAEFVTDNYC